MRIRTLTLLLYAVGCVVRIILLPGARKQGVMDILIDPLTGIVGFNVIQNMVGHIDGELADIKSRAFRYYTRRYMLHATIFALGAIAGVHAAALLVGMLPHKYNILIYSWKHREGDE